VWYLDCLRYSEHKLLPREFVQMLEEVK
jgi:hypothetical protein